MKIKFIKDYAINRGACPLNIGGFDMLETEIVKADTVVDLEKDNGDGAFSDELIKWLIDNGFAEEVKESGWWKPRLGERYYYIGPNGGVYSNQWENDSIDNARLKLGSVFKTEEATERRRDYLEAVATVSQDEGFMKPSRKINYSPCGYGVYRGFGKSIIAEVSDTTVSAGEFYFDTREHALNSAMNHTREWQTILNYDWSKGEEDENEN